MAVAATTRTEGAGATTGAASWVGDAKGIGPPAGAESKANWSMSNPAVWPMVDRNVCRPGPRVTPLVSGPHGETVSAWRSRAAAVDPEMEIQSGAPSIVTRSPRHELGMSAGSGAACNPAIPTSAMPMGMAIGVFE